MKDGHQPWIDLDGRVALVTGAASGIGRAAAVALAEAGAVLVLADRDEAGLAAVAETIGATGGTAYPRPLDVTDDGQWDALADWIETSWGRLDILVNSAGIVMRDHVGDGTDVYRRTFAVNVEGTLLGMAAALRLMRRRGKGTIVNLASAASFRGAQIMASYGASKAAVAHFTRTAAMDAVRAGQDIRINSIHPGLVETSMADDLYDIYSALGSQEAVIQRTTTGRVGKPEEIADLILYLVSDRASYVSGANIPIDRALTA